MSEQFEGQEGAPAVQADAPATVESTGHADVDAVLESLDGLDDRPVQEHVAIFESAHESLRSALAGAGERPAGPATG